MTNWWPEDAGTPLSQRFLVPLPPDFGPPDWSKLEVSAPKWIARMKLTEQDPQHHGEGDVWTHTKMVCTALIASPGWRALAEEQRLVLWVAALLHDVAKPDTSRESDGRIVSPRHAKVGEIKARNILFDIGGLPFNLREQICALIRHHTMPFHLFDRDRDEAMITHRLALGAEVCRLDLLAHLCRADVRGRECGEQNEMLDNISLFKLAAQEQGCLYHPYPFHNAVTRVRYFNIATIGAGSQIYDDTEFTVTILSGLPGTGKSTWRQQHEPDLPVVSADIMRKNMGIKPTDNQGKVVQEVKEAARQHLRKAERFVWDSTNITADMRWACTRLCMDYGAKVRFVYVEAENRDVLITQNDSRPHPVPLSVIDKLMNKWTIPSTVEAHEVVYAVAGDRGPARGSHNDSP